ncbi:PilZ domain-containing protein [Novosphingobium sp. G106]|uniref:PilZ domain-containing protein n=1 Tax=Novosphingobium sp. G106 TaxID=2849500 RepID=UPI001C2CC907|nr:PilZ domain-containing protein [Novosphingobium sp. G106]MBV1688523.1 PilZ domain-containing protein [Novosphingobium sp. G106]
MAIVDLTAEGCRIFTKAVPVSEGLRVSLRPLEFEPLRGVVRWVHRGYAGIEFERPLYGAVAIHLQKAWSSSR